MDECRYRFSQGHLVFFWAVNDLDDHPKGTAKRPPGSGWPFGVGLLILNQGHVYRCIAYIGSEGICNGRLQ